MKEKCSEYLNKHGEGAPRTCMVCKLGPCKYPEKSKPVEYYDKWDVEESEGVAFKKVKNGEWDYDHFKQWLDHRECREFRDNGPSI